MNIWIFLLQPIKINMYTVLICKIIFPLIKIRNSGLGRTAQLAMRLFCNRWGSDFESQTQVKKKKRLDVVAHACNFSAGEIETGDS